MPFKDTYPRETAWQRFDELLNRMLRSGPPDRRTSFRAASATLKAEGISE